MNKIGVAVVGFKNVGKAAVRALEEAGDLELRGVVTDINSLEAVRKQFPEIVFTADIATLEGVDVAVLCLSSPQIPEAAESILKRGINTVDCFDMHSDDIIKLKAQLQQVSTENKVVSISAAGWDPGTDSVIRAMMEIAAPKGITYTNFGPGMSMEHTLAAKAVRGVKNALSVTVPEGFGFHKRCVYVECEPGVDFDEVELNIKKDKYFFDDMTYLVETDNVDSLTDNGHSVLIERKGVASQTSNQRFNFQATMTNPAVTAQTMVSSVRAAMKQKPGNYLLIEIAPIDLLEGEDRNALIKRVV